MTVESFTKLALSFPGTEEKPHFDRMAFRVTKKRIFASVHEPSQTANLKLSPEDQLVLCELGGKSVFPVSNKWGQHGWTTFNLTELSEEIMLDALNSAYNDVFEPRSVSSPQHINHRFRQH